MLASVVTHGFPSFFFFFWLFMLMVRETSSSVFFTFLFLGLHLSYQTSMHVRVRQRPIHMTTFNKHAQWLSGRERRWALLCSSRKWREGVSTVEEMLAINLYSTNGQTSFSACTLCSAIYRASEKNSNAVKKGNKNVLFILRRTFSSSTVDFFFIYSCVVVIRLDMRNTLEGHGIRHQVKNRLCKKP